MTRRALFASTDCGRVKASFRGLVTNEATFPPALPALPGAPAHRLAAGTRPPTHSPCVWALARAQGMAYLPLAAPTEKRLCRQPPNRSPIARSRSISCAFESYPTWYCPEASSPPPSSSSSSTFYSLGFYSALLLAIPRMHVRTALVHARFFAYMQSRHKRHRVQVRRAHKSTVEARKIGWKWAAAHHPRGKYCAAEEDDAVEGVSGLHKIKRVGKASTAHDRERECATGELTRSCRSNAYFSWRRERQTGRASGAREQSAGIMGPSGGAARGADFLFAAGDEKKAVRCEATSASNRP